MTSTKQSLLNMGARKDTLDWVGDGTIAQAWHECRNSDRMLWLLRMIAPKDRRCRLAAADFAERIWHLVVGADVEFVAAWAIAATRRGNKSEKEAAAVAAEATFCAVRAAADAASTVAEASTTALFSAHYAARAVAAAYGTDDNERDAQADILRKHFTAREAQRLFDAYVSRMT